MQLYTKILIGMAVGAIIGLTLGPNSPWLSHNLYKITDASQVHFQRDRADANSRVTLPAGTALRFMAEETIRESRTDATGQPIDVPVWVRGSFAFSRALALRDPSGELHAKLGSPPMGGRVEGWLRLAHTPLTSGGFAISPQPISQLGDTLISWLQPIGKLFLRLIRMVIVPLVFASLLVGVASLGDVRKLGRLGGKTLGLYLATTAIAVTIGLICANIIQPGNFVGEADRVSLLAQFQSAAGSRVSAAAEAPSTTDTILSIIPTNPAAAMTEGDMLQIIFFAIVFGIALTLLGPGEATPVVTFFDKVQQAMIVLIQLVMELAPFGVAALVAEVIGLSGWSVLQALLVYGLTVVIGLAIHAVLVYGGLVQVLAKVSLLTFMRAIRQAQLIAFSTSSSSATLPVSLRCAQERLGISSPVASFVLPLGSTVNMDGTAMYQGVAAVFIAQVFQLDLSLQAQLSIVLTATMASIGAAGVPGAGMITLALVLTTIGVPMAGLALILGIDRILDMCRTAVNVTGDLAVTAVVARSEGEELNPQTQAAAQVAAVD
jgi:Na+/H+-dicarboxylate symporter